MLVPTPDLDHSASIAYSELSCILAAFRHIRHGWHVLAAGLLLRAQRVKMAVLPDVQSWLGSHAGLQAVLWSS